MREALPVVLSERASEAGLLGAVAGGMLGGHARELPQEAGGVRAEPTMTSAMSSMAFLPRARASE